ncbi:MAG TPA: response regulator transcription factor [Agriterribacter sp.]|nr:response regulator transcription factor [Chitinophagaceae bacterium]HRP32589.1 response regulator transcription factor [Agriterribacter sp.]
MIRIVIVDDHPEVRKAWIMFLQRYEHISVVGECTNGPEAIDRVPELNPDIILMDINMKPMSGIEATQILTQKYPGVKVIGVSFHTSSVYIKKMLAAGARGYIFKYAVVEDLLPAIYAVHSGTIFLGKGVIIEP